MTIAVPANLLVIRACTSHNKPFMIKYLYIVSIFAAAIFCGGNASAAAPGEPDSVAVTIVRAINDSGVVVVEQPAALDKRLERVEESNAESAENDVKANSGVRSRSGYRVEVFADNNVRTAKVAAANRKRQLQARLPQYKVYLVFEAPFWRVRIGDFTSRSEAESALAEVRRVMPGQKSGLRIVRCTINPR